MYSIGDWLSIDGFEGDENNQHSRHPITIDTTAKTPSLSSSSSSAAVAPATGVVDSSVPPFPSVSLRKSIRSSDELSNLDALHQHAKQMDLTLEQIVLEWRQQRCKIRRERIQRMMKQQQQQQEKEEERKEEERRNDDDQHEQHQQSHQSPSPHPSTSLIDSFTTFSASLSHLSSTVLPNLSSSIHLNHLVGRELEAEGCHTLARSKGYVARCETVLKQRLETLLKGEIRLDQRQIREKFKREEEQDREQEEEKSKVHIRSMSGVVTPSHVNSQPSNRLVSDGGIIVPSSSLSSSNTSEMAIVTRMLIDETTNHRVTEDNSNISHDTTNIDKAIQTQQQTPMMMTTTASIDDPSSKDEFVLSSSHDPNTSCDSSHVSSSIPLAQPYPPTSPTFTANSSDEIDPNDHTHQQQLPPPASPPQTSTTPTSTHHRHRNRQHHQMRHNQQNVVDGSPVSSAANPSQATTSPSRLTPVDSLPASRVGGLSSGLVALLDTPQLARAAVPVPALTPSGHAHSLPSAMCTCTPRVTTAGGRHDCAFRSPPMRITQQTSEGQTTHTKASPPPPQATATTPLSNNVATNTDNVSPSSNAHNRIHFLESQRRQEDSSSSSSQSALSQLQLSQFLVPPSSLPPPPATNSDSQSLSLALSPTHVPMQSTHHIATMTTITTTSHTQRKEDGDGDDDDGDDRPRYALTDEGVDHAHQPASVPPSSPPSSTMMDDVDPAPPTNLRMPPIPDSPAYDADRECAVLCNRSVDDDIVVDAPLMPRMVSTPPPASPPFTLSAPSGPARDLNRRHPPSRSASNPADERKYQLTPKTPTVTRTSGENRSADSPGVSDSVGSSWQRKRKLDLTQAEVNTTPSKKLA